MTIVLVEASRILYPREKHSLRIYQGLVLLSNLLDLLLL